LSTKGKTEIDVPSPGLDGPDRPRATAGPPWSAWAHHLVEMILVMMIGMMILSLPVSAVAGALGYRDLSVQQPSLATLVMALQMTVPMALWMGYRGHHRRGVLEMSAVMIVPAIVLVAAAQVGLIASPGLVSTYHVTMLASMVGLMVLRRAEYSSAAAPIARTASASPTESTSASQRRPRR